MFHMIYKYEKKKLLNYIRRKSGTKPVASFPARSMQLNKASLIKLYGKRPS